MPTFSRVQSQCNNNGTLVSLGSSPTAGNLLVAVAGDRAGTSHTVLVVSDSEGGWTKAFGHDNELSDPLARCAMAVFYKTATGSSPTTINQSGGMSLDVHEFAAGEAVTWVHETQASASTGTGSSPPLSIGPTGSASAGNLLTLGIGLWREDGSNDPTSIAFSSISIPNVISQSGGSNHITHALGLLQESASGTRSTSLSWSGSGFEGIGAILIFGASTAGGSALTKDLSESLTLGDDQSDAAAFARARIDPIALAEVLARAAAFASSRADPLSLAEVLSTAAAFAHTTTDPLDLDELLFAVTARAYSIADNVVLAEALSVVLLLTEALTDTLSLADALTLTAGVLRTVADPLSIEDSLATLSSFTREVASQLALADSHTLQAAFQRSVSSALAIAGAASFSSAFARSEIDSLLLGDAILAQVIAETVLPSLHLPAPSSAASSLSAGGLATNSPQIT